MNVGGILKSGAAKFKTAAKTVTKDIASKATKTSSNPKALTKASEALSNQGKASINISKDLFAAEKSAEKKAAEFEKRMKIDKFVKEGIKSGLTPEQAVKNAKATVSVMGPFSGKSAYLSGEVFEKGLTQTEKKAQLMEKYGEKLRAQQEQNSFKKAMEEARELY